MSYSEIKKSLSKVYHSMNLRCTENSKVQIKFPSYKGCQNDFESFEDFYDWAVTQKGHDLGWDLDKDLISKGNKIYSKDFCIFVPHIVNNSIISAKRSRGLMPIGVTQDGDTRKKKFKAAMTMNGRSINLGRFATAIEAFYTYKLAKEGYLKYLAETYKYDIDIRAYNALMNYRVDLED